METVSSLAETTRNLEPFAVHRLRDRDFSKHLARALASQHAKWVNPPLQQSQTSLEARKVLAVSPCQCV